MTEVSHCNVSSETFALNQDEDSTKHCYYDENGELLPFMICSDELVIQPPLGSNSIYKMNLIMSPGINDEYSPSHGQVVSSLHIYFQMRLI